MKLKILCSLLILLTTSAAPLLFAAPVKGYVDLHAHFMAEYSLGGNWFWGSIEGSEETALKKCDGGWISKHGVLDNPLLGEVFTSYHNLNCPKTGSFLDKLSCGDTGIHLGKRNGFETRKECFKIDGKEIPGSCPKENYVSWPRWDSHAHQQMWKGWLKKAHENGLQIMVVSFTESSFLCQLTFSENRKYSCDETESIKRQIAAANKFITNNNNWVGLATSSDQARSLVESGKLALVYAVEISKLFSEGDIIKQLDEFYQMGIRSIQVVHHENNRFSGAVPIPRLNLAAAAYEATHESDITHIDNIVCKNAQGIDGVCDGINYLNPLGLTADGVTLIQAMMNRKMLVDIAHMSRQSIKQTFAISQQRNNYPLFYSHAHFLETILPALPGFPNSGTEINEKFIMPDEIDMIKITGGMVGLRTGPERSVKYKGNPAVDNNCQGSSRSFAQHLMYGIDNGLNIGFGSDLNGFIEQIIPRFGNSQESCWGNSSEQRAQTGNKQRAFDRNGLAHVGLLPELMDDLVSVGLPQQYTDHINNSAEAFLTMWKAAEK